MNPQSPWQTMPEDLLLGEGEVHLFLVGTDLPLEAFDALSGVLTEGEREQFQKFRMPQKRVEAILSRALLRERLSRFLNVEPRKIVLAYNPHGKPGIEGSNIHFNISHTAGYVLLGVGLDHELGVDIECPREDLEHENLAKRFFTPSEHAALVAMPAENRVNAFFRCWTRKEAVLKGMGRGISAGLDTFEVSLQPGRGPMMVGEWTLHDLPAPHTHVAALATRCKNARLCFWWWQPPQW
jgi:4'-phosphopantetheinyl transferase